MTHSATSVTLGALIAASLKRHRFILITLPACCFVMSLVFTLVTPKHYDAFGLMEVTPRVWGATLFDTQALTLPNDSTVLSHIEMLKSPAVLRDTAHRLQSPYDVLQRAVTISTVGRSYIIRVAARGRTPDQAQTIANTLMDVYQTHQRRLKIDRLEQTTRWLNEHIAQLAAQARGSARAASRYRTDFNVDDGTADRQQLSDLSTQFVKAQLDLTEAQVARTLSNTRSADTLLTQQMTSPVLIALSQQEAMLRQKDAELRQKYAARHPDRLATQAALAAVLTKRAQEVSRLTQSLQQDERVATGKIDKLHKQFALLQDKAHQDDERAVQLQQLDDDARVTRALYENMLQKSKETSVSADFGMLDVQIVSRADRPARASNAKGVLVVLLGTAAGFILALATLIVSEQLATPVGDARS